MFRFSNGVESVEESDEEDRDCWDDEGVMFGDSGGVRTMLDAVVEWGALG
jgi:hypothetical protein